MAIFWSNVAVAAQSALATAQTITGVTKADPGVVTTSGTLPSNGDYVLLTISGMHQLDGRVLRVANASGTTFELEGEDTSAYSTFSSGSFQVITFGTSVTTISDVSASGGEPEFEDTTTIHDNVRKQVPTVTSAVTFSFTSQYDSTDTALIALAAASKAIAKRAFMFTFSSGEIMLFNGYVSLPMTPAGSAQGLVTTPMTLTAESSITTYSS